MIIDIIDEDSYLTVEQSKLIEDVVNLTASYLGFKDEAEVDISIVSNEEIHQLNLEYRQIDRPTDVLSFALEEVASEFDLPDLASFMAEFNQNKDSDSDEDNSDVEEVQGLARHLGDIIISFQRAQEQAEDYGHSFERELAFLAVHGFLHLNGFDHQTEEEEAQMFGIQEEVLSQYGLTR